MNEYIKYFLSSLNIGKISRHNNMSIIPVFTSAAFSEQYTPVAHAVEHGILSIREKTKHSPSSKLQIINKGDKPVFILP